MTSIVVVTAGSSIPSSSRMLGERLGEAAAAALADDGGSVEVTHLELRTLAADLANHLTTRVPSARLSEAVETVRGADGVIAVSPVLNGSYSGLFKLFFDALDEDTMNSRPVLLAATGGTARHSLVIEHALLPLFFYLKAEIAPEAVFAATKDWGSEGGKLDRRIKRAALSFAEIVLASSPSKDEGDFKVVDFGDLLDG